MPDRESSDSSRRVSKVSRIEEFVAQLAPESAYKRHRGQVVSLTTTHLKVLKRRLRSRGGYEVVEVPLSECAKIEYTAETSKTAVVGGLLLFFLMVSMAYLVALTWDDLDPGTLIPVGAIACVAVFGLRLVEGGRRHKLVFAMRDGSRKTWRSLSGDFKVRSVPVQRVLRFAQNAGLFTGEASLDA